MTSAGALRRERPASTDIRDAIADRGLHVGLSLTPAELTQFTAAIEQSFLRRIEAIAPDRLERFRAAGMADYHRHCAGALDHAAAWPKSARLLPPAFADNVRDMAFFRAIEMEYGPVRIFDDELNWRLVRPYEEADVGPPHLDAWFWDCGHGHMPKGCDRFKVWIAIAAEPGRSGLKVAPESHRKHFRWHIETRDGMFKPAIDEREEDLGLELLPLAPGEMILFHDRLMHAGAINHGGRCRVSIEFTLLTQK